MYKLRRVALCWWFAIGQWITWGFKKTTVKNLERGTRIKRTESDCEERHKWESGVIQLESLGREIFWKVVGLFSSSTSFTSVRDVIVEIDQGRIMSLNVCPAEV